MPRFSLLRCLLAFAAIAACAVVPSGASAATVVNGSFETGDLSGWSEHYSSGESVWYVESAEEAAAESWFPPPAGNFFAGDEQGSPDTPILYQDIALEPGYSHQLSMVLYYESEAPIAVPTPDTLASDGSAAENQQLRVDVMRPSAPIESVDPADILATVFANHNGDPQSMSPQRFTADLTPFAGQTVRLRIANAVQEEPFFAAIDDVTITSTPPPPALPVPPPLPAPPPAPSNLISRGKLTLNKKKGSAKLAIMVRGPGSLSMAAKGKKKKVKPAKLAPTAAGSVVVPVKPTRAGLAVLKAKGKLKVALRVTFTPTGGTANTQTYKVTLKKKLRKRRH